MFGFLNINNTVLLLLKLTRRKRSKERKKEMDVSVGTGGFHGYRRPRQTSPASASSGGMIPQETKTGAREQQANNTVSSDQDNECTIREQDRFMPIANVIRIMRRILPPHAKISDDAKETIQECVSEFISFITGEANERCQHEQRKTITAEDVLWAMSKLGFDDYIEPLTLYLHRYREFDGGERGGGSMRTSEPPSQVKRQALDHTVNGGYGPMTTTFRMGHHHHGFFAGGGMHAGLLRDAQGAAVAAAPSPAALEPYARCKE